MSGGSREPGGPFETGGGLLAARAHLRGEAPLFLHNVDVLTDFSLTQLYAAHVLREPLATLAVMERETSRRLLFDDRGLLGRLDSGRGLDLRARPAEGSVVSLGFSGVHVVSPDLLSRITERGVFGITEIAPIITQPQVGVIGVGAAVETPVVRDGQVVVRSIMHVTLAADHRATDGADGARFLQTLRQNLEQPGLMLL